MNTANKTNQPKSIVYSDLLLNASIIKQALALCRTSSKFIFFFEDIDELKTLINLKINTNDKKIYDVSENLHKYKFLQMLFATYNNYYKIKDRYHFDKISYQELKSRIKNLSIEYVPIKEKETEGLRHFVKKILDKDYIYRSNYNNLKCIDILCNNKNGWLIETDKNRLLINHIKNLTNKAFTVIRFLKICNDNLYKISSDNIKDSSEYILNLLPSKNNKITELMLKVIKDICINLNKDKNKKVMINNLDLLSPSEIGFEKKNGFMCGLNIERIIESIDYFLTFENNNQFDSIILKQNIKNIKKKLLEEIKYNKLDNEGLITCLLLCEDCNKLEGSQHKIRHLINDNFKYITNSLENNSLICKMFKFSVNNKLLLKYIYKSIE